MNTQAILAYILSRLKEKSTWTALGAMLTGIGVAVKPEQWQLIMTVGLGVAGFLGTVLPARVDEKNVAPAPDHITTPLSAAMETKLQVPEANITPAPPAVATPLSDKIQQGANP